MSLIKLSLDGNNLIIPAGTGKSLTFFLQYSDIPAGDGKIANLFLQCRCSWIIITEKVEWKWGERDRQIDPPMGRGGGIAKTTEY
jgi:hypothetical protein